MNSTWRFRASLALISILLAIWLCIPSIPTFLGDTTSQEPHENQNLDWYEKILPKSRVRLGLDLQGGIHMVLGIDLRRALMNEVDRYVRDLKEYLPKEKDPIEVASIGRDFDSTEIQIKLQNTDDRKKFENYLQDRFVFLKIIEENTSDLSYKLDLSDQRKAEVEKQTIEQALGTLRDRLDQFGVAEPSIQAKGNDRIIIQLPGMDDPARAKSVIGRTAQLEFKIVDDESMDEKRLDLLVQEAKVSLPREFKNDQLNRALKDKIPAGTQVLFKEEKDPTTNENNQMPVLVKAQTLLTGDMLEDARIGVDQDNTPTVNLTFNQRGSQLVDQITGENMGKRLAIVLDDKVQSDPVIRARISNGRPQITFGALKSRMEIMQEAKDLALVLRSGALPAPVEVLQNSVVGPSLGRDSIEKGMKAMVIGVILVVVFMLIYYRGAGVAADIAVMINLLFTIAALGGLNATLTLPGIAGIIISVGMAVDANVIIYERIREELRRDKPVRAAVEAAYERAHLTIIDTHLTTIMGGLVLMEYGTGPIKGFAVTLILGLIANYFTALWFTRLGFEWVIAKFNPERFSV